MNLLKTVIGLTKVYVDANKQNVTNVQITDECYNISLVYSGLELCEDEYFVYLGEYGNESFDISIVKSKIVSMGVHSGSIIIDMINGKKFIITIDTECEVEDCIYRFTPTD